ncbi:PDE11 [Lepeophtheirus salmonis]|uniref:Phosphodiesterase n=2 Tax=Lepeophtheirus salmonis TaxID=72036 RepID=A0A7R8CVB7_LEPSM|nr:PDE11 [Lepeophtheirus salmonis]CAF2942312.1 PDE11 [Lepeophtheirus salmonis]
MDEIKDNYKTTFKTFFMDVIQNDGILNGFHDKDEFSYMNPGKEENWSLSSGLPLISGNESITEKIIWIDDFHLKALANLKKPSSQDTPDFLRPIKEITLKKYIIMNLCELAPPEKTWPTPPVSWNRHKIINSLLGLRGKSMESPVTIAKMAAAAAAAAHIPFGIDKRVSTNSDYDPHYAEVESWLDEHPEFFQEYLIRKGTRSMIDSCNGHSHKSNHSSSHGPPPTKKNYDSGAPVRKVSAHEFEKGGLTKPLVTTTLDGTPTFLCPIPFSDSPNSAIRKRSRNDILGMNESELIFELVKDICNDLDRMQIVQGEGESRCLVSDLFDISSNSSMEDSQKKKTEIRIPWGSGIVGHVAKSGVAVNIPDCYMDERFNQEVDNMTGYHTKSMLCTPIRDLDGAVIGIAQVINKAGDGHFTKNDEILFGKYLQFCGIGLCNAQLYERSQLEVKRNQVLLDLARVIFQEQSTIDNVVHRILTHMLSLIRCERAMLLLVHDRSPGTFSRVFDLEASEVQDEEKRVCPSFEGRFPINTGITGYVASTAETVNTSDAYSDPRFDKKVDHGTDFKHRTILSMPIFYNQTTNKVIGVFQLVNKFDNLPFTTNDENFVEAFAIFCGMGIHNVHMYEKTVVAMAKQQVTLEVLSYHATAPVEEAIKLSRQKVPSAAALSLHSFSFNYFGLENDETLLASIRMFIDLDFPGRFHIDYLLLCRWFTSVKKNYRDVTYHNWRHAFNVAQMMFAVITASQWWKTLGDVECLSLMIACLCHDLDHRGTNNSFQVKSSSNLAQLYSTSTMEHHHFDQCLMILNSKGNQILQNLTQDEFKRVVNVLEDAILATDLALYFSRRNETLNLIETGSLDVASNEHHRSLFRGLLMTACDLGAITKPWESQKKVAKLVSAEFLYQGDLEKDELHLEPIDMMNRDKQDRLPAHVRWMFHE